MTHIPISIVSLIDQEDVRQKVKVESRNREVHLPPVSVYRWWARRTSAVNTAIVEAAEFVLPKQGALYIGDPFCGGGVIPMTALQRGHAVYAQDLNPWVTKGLSSALSLPSSAKIEKSAKRIFEALAPLSEMAYRTTFLDGESAYLSQTFRVAVTSCATCKTKLRLFPHALISRTIRKDRKPKNKKFQTAFIACRNGHLYKGYADRDSKCSRCNDITNPSTTYLPKRIHTCHGCGTTSSLERLLTNSGLKWEIALVERSKRSRREIDFPTERETEQADHRVWVSNRCLGPIPSAHETKVLLRHGFKSFNDLYPMRQKFVMESIEKTIKDQPLSEQMKNAFLLALWGTAEMAGHLSRWDRHYLKSYESMASHRFNFTTFTSEPNVIGKDCMGRGSFYNRVNSLVKATKWLDAQGIDLPYRSPINADERTRRQVPTARLNIVCGSSERMLLADNSLDLILTDPPYHDDVQYHELSLPFRAWAGLSVERAVGEAVAIPKSEVLDGHKTYRDQLIPIFKECERVLKPSGRLIFSYANREPAAWVNLFAALRAADLRPVGFTIVHSENETESGKSKKRACNLDLVMELAPRASAPAKAWMPEPVLGGQEETYLLAVGTAFVRSFDLINGWETHLLDDLKSELFLQDLKVLNSPDVVANPSVKSKRRVTMAEVPSPFT